MAPAPVFEVISSLVALQSKSLSFFLNGKEVTIEKPDPFASLLSFVRGQGLTGAKLGCGEGVCGTCTMVVASYSPDKGSLRYDPVNGCLMPLCAADGKHVITIEGVGTVKQPHIIQTTIVDNYGSQCGYCTPGMVLSLYALLCRNPNPSEQQIEDAFDGNVCRCTGYRPILQGAKKFCATATADVEDLLAVTPPFKSAPAMCDHDMDTKLRQSSTASSFVFTGADGSQWLQPNTVNETISLLGAHPEAQIISGNLEVGIETRFKGKKTNTLIYIGAIQELTKVSVHESGVELGAGLTLHELENEVTVLSELEGAKGKGFAAIKESVRKIVAGEQVRHTGTLGGNICMSRTISDLAPTFMALGSSVYAASAKGRRTIPLSDFYAGLGKNKLAQSEIMTSIYVPFLEDNDYIKVAKSKAKTRDDALAAPTACFYVRLDGAKVQDARLCFGGVAERTMLAKSASEALIGKQWSESLVEAASRLLKNDLPLYGINPEHRFKLASGLLYKLHIYLSSHVPGLHPVPRSEGADDLLHRPLATATTSFNIVPPSQVVGAAVVHKAALQQSTGEAVYVSDQPLLEGECVFIPVLSTVAHALIISIDASEALKVPGVVDFVSAKDLTAEQNVTGVFDMDEEIFASKEVFHQGQFIGGIVAKNGGAGMTAARLVKVQYKILPVILSIDEAIKQKSFFGATPMTQAIQHVSRGALAFPEQVSDDDIQVDMSLATHTIKGRICTSAQEHMYLETMSCRVIPRKEDGEVEVYGGGQGTQIAHQMASKVFGVPANRIVSRSRRLGGAFGGKESRSRSLLGPVLAASFKTGLPIRAQFSRAEDMQVMGMRHPFQTDYEVGFTDDGRLISLKADLVSNGGYSIDASPMVMWKALQLVDSCYFIPNLRLTGRVAKTNLVSFTAFRGFGGPQGLIVGETIVDEVANKLGIPSHIVRQRNFFSEGQSTCMRNPIGDLPELMKARKKTRTYHAPACWDQVMTTSEFEARLAKVKEFNAKNRFHKRGLSAIPTKYSVGFRMPADALVHAHLDGSVLLLTGATEMGQGVHTKLMQIAAQALGIPVASVNTLENTTVATPNQSVTGGSLGTDLWGPAVLAACNILAERLKPVRDDMPDATFAEICTAAHHRGLSLSAHGHSAGPTTGYSNVTNQGASCYYFTPGVGVCEVELDVLTGDYVLLRTDIVMDLGESLNPGIDIGQIEGAYLQGVGWSSIEEPLWNESGDLLTRGPGAYRTPLHFNAPAAFNVAIRKDGKNSSGLIHSSRGVGEPPLFLGASAYFAVKDAVRAARLENGLTDSFEFDLPCVPSRVLKAIGA
ncbi:hypothetical protein SmJEL517_g04004 [Synchytrium microbalum]|uniref:Xanthine dehydrogenase n=1 Tax=Synchytrium microbalum TaxID=1806994 RepID=A0A507BU34_9FUNG|nr:uncharacterized protein SmJEL517_g04004 [Synchytrium microbalum]TPX33020.1 hypothetical protein SmJEL517_g04004 [Synchytrium microbalum]